MAKHPSLDDLLTAEQKAFLEPEAKSRSPKQPDKPKEEPPMPRPALKESFPEETLKTIPQMSVSRGGFALTVKVDTTISDALLRASMERKLQRLAPFTQREIVTEAVTEWLKAKGYLK